MLRRHLQCAIPLFGKISVKGPKQHPPLSHADRRPAKRVDDGLMQEKLRSYGIETGDAGDVLWNFEKFLVAQDGQVVERFARTSGG